jgi:hypothetical protein
MRPDDHSKVTEAGFFSIRVAPRLRTASPAEADSSLHREGPVSSVCKRGWLQE